MIFFEFSRDVLRADRELTTAGRTGTKPSAASEKRRDRGRDRTTPAEQSVVGRGMVFSRSARCQARAENAATGRRGSSASRPSRSSVEQILRCGPGPVPRSAASVSGPNGHENGMLSPTTARPRQRDSSRFD